MEQVASLPSSLKPSLVRSARPQGDHLQLARLLLALEPSALGLDEGYRVTGKIDCRHRQVLLPIGRVIEKLHSARAAARECKVPLELMVCTAARCGAALSEDSDPRDSRHLSGVKTADALPAYCGGLDAAIHRAELLASHADVVCFRAASVDFNEARRFAEEVRKKFPNKTLGFAHSPRPDGEPWNESLHSKMAQELDRLGFDYYFLTLFGTALFPVRQPSGPWVLFDDAAPRTATENFESSEAERNLYSPPFGLTSRLHSRVHRQMTQGRRSERAI